MICTLPISRFRRGINEALPTQRLCHSAGLAADGYIERDGGLFDPALSGQRAQHADGGDRPDRGHGGNDRQPYQAALGLDLRPARQPQVADGDWLCTLAGRQAPARPRQHLGGSLRCPLRRPFRQGDSQCPARRLDCRQCRRAPARRRLWLSARRRYAGRISWHRPGHRHRLSHPAAERTAQQQYLSHHCLAFHAADRSGRRRAGGLAPGDSHPAHCRRRPPRLVAAELQRELPLGPVVRGDLYPGQFDRRLSSSCWRRHAAPACSARW